MRYTLFFILFFSISASAQDFGMVLRKGRTKHINYLQFDPMMIKYHDSIYRGRIFRIEADRFLLDTNWHKIEEIQAVYDFAGRSFVQKGAVAFPKAGLFFFVITTINQGLAKTRPLLYRGHYMPSIGLIAAGILMYPFQYKRYGMKSWRLITIPI